MNSPFAPSKFVPKQALLPTPALYDELVGDGMTQLATASLSLLPPIPSYSTIHDNGCGTGAATSSILSSLPPKTQEVKIVGTDNLHSALTVYSQNAVKHHWKNVEFLEMNAEKLDFGDGVFDLSFWNALVFVGLQNDGVTALKESYRTLKKGGKLIVNSWAHTPTLGPVVEASKATRPKDFPLPRKGLDKWSEPEFLKGKIVEAGFEEGKIRLEKVDVLVETTELGHFSRMLWSFIGGTGEGGWVESDEGRWGEALEVVERELRAGKGFMDVEGGKAKIKFVANVAVATK